MTPSSPQKLVRGRKRNTSLRLTSSRWDFGKETEMTEIVPVRDWLAELTSLAEAGDAAVFLRLAKQSPAELRPQVCKLAGEWFKNGEAWARSFFISPEIQPSVDLAASRTADKYISRDGGAPTSQVQKTYEFATVEHELVKAQEEIASL